MSAITRHGSVIAYGLFTNSRIPSPRFQIIHKMKGDQNALVIKRTINISLFVIAKKNHHHRHPLLKPAAMLATNVKIGGCYCSGEPSLCNLPIAMGHVVRNRNSDLNALIELPKITYRSHDQRQLQTHENSDKVDSLGYPNQPQLDQSSTLIPTRVDNKKLLASIFRAHRSKRVLSHGERHRWFPKSLCRK